MTNWFHRVPAQNELLKVALESMHSTALATARAAEVMAQAHLESAKALQAHLDLFKAPHPAPKAQDVDEKGEQLSYLRKLAPEYTEAQRLLDELEGV